MPHPIVEIDELLRLALDRLIETSPRTVVSLALTCRSLEEPALSSLWQQRCSLPDLVKVLPNHTCVKDERGVELSVAIEHDPSAEDWARLRRYASWMRGLHLGPGGNITSDTLFRLSSNSPGGVLFPKLESLLWNIQKTSTALTFFRLFLSPHLRYVVFCALPSLPAVPRDQLATLAQVISFLPTSLEDLIIVCGQEEGPLSDAVSSFICRCGPSLRGLCVHAPLSEAAIHHLMGLPNLRYWATVQGPPPIVPASIFPSLRDLRLEKPTALPWLHLLASHAEGVHRDVPHQ